MKLVPFDENVNSFKKTVNLDILNDFAKSEHECAMVTNYCHKDAHSCANSLKQSVKRFGMYNINVFVRRGDVFLVKNPTNK